jgi:glycosyltransferase involved in cell wall biosynthesis
MAIFKKNKQMKITFISNYINHYQKPFCDELYKQLGDKFKFVQTQELDDERITMGWERIETYPYLIKSYSNTDGFNKTVDLINKSDVVIYGSAPFAFIKERLKNDKLTFIYTERFFKKGYKELLRPLKIISLLRDYSSYRNNKNSFLLCASAYTAYDNMRLFAYPNYKFKWGYFPEIANYEFTEILKQKNKDKIHLLWAGRLIDWKHPEHAVEVAKRLKEENFNFHLSFIGCGVTEDYLKNIVSKSNLNNEVSFLGQMKPNEVRDYMLKSNIFLFTSSFEEGWGVVLNEAMNSGCAVVASHSSGSVNFLLKDRVNGLIYKYGCIDDLFSRVKELFLNRDFSDKLGKNAMESIINEWNPFVASSRFLSLAKNLLENNSIISYSTGPLSEAKIIKNNWYKTEK